MRRWDPYKHRMPLLAALTLSLALEAHGDARFDYLLHCGGCHLENGAGDPPEVPDLRRDLAALLEVSGGRAYLVQVPGASHAPLDDAALADVLNWILDAFYPQADGLVRYTAAEVARYRRQTEPDPLRRRAELLGSRLEEPPAPGGAR